MDVEDWLLALLPVLVLVALFVLAAFWISRRARMRELAHREWLAMIEKGLVPPAELLSGSHPLAVLHGTAAGGTPSRAAARFRSAGVMLVGLGAALVLVIALAAGQPSIGLGVGGAIAVLGAAMIVNGVLGARELPAAPPVRHQSPGSPADLDVHE